MIVLEDFPETSELKQTTGILKKGDEEEFEIEDT